MQSCVTTAAARCDGLLVATGAPHGQQAQTQAADRYWAVPGVGATCLADTPSGLHERWLFASACQTQVEILLTEFWDPISGPIFPNRGDQERFWKITRRFVEELSTALKTPVVNAVRIGLGSALCARCGDLQATGLAAWRGESVAAQGEGSNRSVRTEGRLLGSCCMYFHHFWCLTCNLNSSTHTQVQAFASPLTVCQPCAQVYPDAGVAAMLSYQWKEDGIPFRITSLTDRLPVR